MSRITRDVTSPSPARYGAAASVLITALWLGPGIAASAEPSTRTEYPLWAFPTPLPRPATPSSEKNLSVPGSAIRFSEAQLGDRSTAMDWFPSSHAPMPAVVAGNRTGADACGYCHLPTGEGRPENAPIAGLPYSYLVDQLHEMQSGQRGALPHFGASELMLRAVQQLSDADIEAAAGYYAAIPYAKHLRVVEAGTVPHFTVNGTYRFDGEGPPEPLGERILEGPDDWIDFWNRDSHSTYTAYVPVGAIARGATLAQGDGPRRLACSACHDSALRGFIGPPLAGRSPTVTFRQLYAFQQDLRMDRDAPVMKAVLGGLSISELIDLSAYSASLLP